MVNKLKNIVIIAFIGSLLAACKQEPLSITIAHVNDTGSHFDEQIVQLSLPDSDSNQVPTFAFVGGYPRISTKVESLRQEALDSDRAFALLHAGDAFTGTLFFTLYNGTLNSDFMNYIGFDAMAIGNHEFDRGNTLLSEFSESLSFPLLSANVKTTPEDDLFGKYLPFTIKLYDEQPVAIVGLTTTFTSIISSPSENTRFIDEIEAAKKVVKKLRLLGINKIIFLTHVGLELDQELAANVDGIDAIIGGHSNDFLGDHTNIGLGDQGPSPIMVTSPSGDPVCIMQSGEQSLALGVTNIDFDEYGVIESCNANNVFLVGELFAQGLPPAPVDSVTGNVIYDYISNAPNIEIVDKDPQAQSMLDIAKAEVQVFSSTEIGAVEQSLFHVRLPGDAHPEQGVIPLGSMVAPHVAQSMVFKMENVSGQSYVAMMNAGGVRSDLIGTITVGDSFTVLPFASTLVSMSVSGASLSQTLQTNVSNAYGISGVAFPYVANITYGIDLTDPQNPQVVDIRIMSAQGVYEPIDLNQQYNLVTTSYLAGGGDLYSFPDATNITDTGHLDGEVLSEYIQAQPGGVLQVLKPAISLIP